MKYDRIRKLCARRGTPSKHIPRERPLSKAERAEVLAKTGGRCHLCAGVLRKRWRVDHVVPHYLEGAATLSNFLPICRECNGLRGGYRRDVLRLIMRLGIYAKQEIRHDTALGKSIAGVVYARLKANKKRRRRAV